MSAPEQHPRNDQPDLDAIGDSHMPEDLREAVVEAERERRDEPPQQDAKQEDEQDEGEDPIPGTTPRSGP